MRPAATKPESEVRLPGEVEVGVDVGQIGADDERSGGQASLLTEACRGEIRADERVSERIQAEVFYGVRTLILDTWISRRCQDTS